MTILSSTSNARRGLKIFGFNGFTLAEVLITITVIGVIAAITIPVVIPFVQERVYSYRHANIVHKITKATDVMKSLGELQKFQSTDDFVDALEKHIKIIKRCDSEHLTDCWPTEEVTNSDGEKVKIQDMKTRLDLGYKLGKGETNTNNVGIILSDGAALIMTYSNSNAGLDPTDATIASSKTLPVGGNQKEFLEFTTNSTAGLGFLVDVNGSKKPNSETIGAKYHDIRNLNGATFGGCGGIKLGAQCYASVDSYNSLNCSRKNVVNGDYSTGTLNNTDNEDYCGNASSLTEDYWAGAVKACSDLGMKLPSQSQLATACSNKTKLKLTNDRYWGDTNDGSYYAYALVATNCVYLLSNRPWAHKVMCVR